VEWPDPFRGANRPTWYQGQPAYTEEGFAPILRQHCARCGGKLDLLQQENGLALRFCSNACRVFHHRNAEQRTLDDYHDAQRAAGELKRLERLTTCPCCGVECAPAKWRPIQQSRGSSDRCSKQHYFVKLREAMQAG
jgi:hypothetical protein